jgi:hypothetical protein
VVGSAIGVVGSAVGVVGSAVGVVGSAVGVASPPTSVERSKESGGRALLLSGAWFETGLRERDGCCLELILLPTVTLQTSWQIRISEASYSSRSGAAHV